jgi:glycosyltransferase involved in cell wall biosynthesis
MSYLVEALKQLSSMLDTSDHGLMKEDIFLTLAGLNTEDLIRLLPFPAKSLGYLQEDVTLALAYQAADIFVCPSVEDTGPMMIPESMLCGTPVVAFDSGIAPDLVKKMKTGYLATYKDILDLANGMRVVLSSEALSEMGQAARIAALNTNSPRVVADKLLALYQSMSLPRQAANYHASSLAAPEITHI